MIILFYYGLGAYDGLNHIHTRRLALCLAIESFKFFMDAEFDPHHQKIMLSPPPQN